jgi:hypothetical protein
MTPQFMSGPPFPDRCKLPQRGSPCGWRHSLACAFSTSSPAAYSQREEPPDFGVNSRTGMVVSDRRSIDIGAAILAEAATRWTQRWRRRSRSGDAPVRGQHRRRRLHGRSHRRQAATTFDYARRRQASPRRRCKWADGNINRSLTAAGYLATDAAGARHGNGAQESESCRERRRDAGGDPRRPRFGCRRLSCAD